jgi:TRAP transporter 4TM/12TM fusion protein
MWTNVFSQGGKREFIGVAGKGIYVLCLAIAVYHIYILSIGAFEVFVHRVIHVCSILAVCWLTYSFSEKDTSKFLVIDIFLAVLSLVIMIYLVANSNRLIYERVMLDPTSLTRLDIFFGMILIVMLLEMSRRTMGPWLGLISLFFLIHAYAGPYLGGVLHHAGYSFRQIVDITVFTEQGIFSAPVGVCSTYIILFMIFAGFVQMSGAGDFFTQLAKTIAGESRGGPAKVSVVGSALMATITGSPTANVAVTGTITIPLMKSAGIEPYFAAAVEAAAATGGPLMPPVMAGTTFIMAELAGVSYWNVCVAAFIPACLYYLGIFTQVHFYSMKHNIGGLRRDEIPPFWRTVKHGVQHCLPFIILASLLANGYSPMRAALWSVPFVILASWVRRGSRIGIKELLTALKFSVMLIRMIMVATALAGILMGVLMATGLATKFLVLLTAFSQESLIVVLLISAAASLIFGLSLSMLTTYILIAIFIVPAAVALKVDPLAAHLFAFYYSILSTITPPVGATFYQTAALANAPPFKTGWVATRLAIAAFVVPFFFVYYPGLLLKGSLTSIIISVMFASTSIFFLSVALEGWLIGSLSIPQRIVICIAACLLIIIKPITAIIGIITFTSVIIWQRKQNRSRREALVLQ